MSGLDNIAASRLRAKNEFNEITNQLVRQLFKEAQIKKTDSNLLPLNKLLTHLNPIVTLPDVASIMEPEETEARAVLECMPARKRVDHMCILCEESVPNHKYTSLTINDAARILMAGVMEKSMTLEYAEEAICKHPLKVCKSHATQMYEMMCVAVQANNVKEVDLVPAEHMQKCCDMYKQLRGVRNNLDGKQNTNTPLTTFRMAIKSFFNIYTPKSLDMGSRSRMTDILKTVPPTTSLKELLFSERHKLSVTDEEDLLEAMRRSKRTNEGDASSSSTPSNYDRDLLFERIQEKRTTERNRRYDSYPEEMRELMKPIDDLYEKQTAMNRSKMIEIRQKKTDEVADPNRPPLKRARRAPVAYSSLAQNIVNRRLPETEAERADGQEHGDDHQEDLQNDHREEHEEPKEAKCTLMDETKPMLGLKKPKQEIEDDYE